MRSLPSVFALVLTAAAAGGTAHADERADKKKALSLFEKSDRAYKAGKFEQAVKLLRDAYALYPEPTLLYNLGRAQEGLGDVPGAIESYERYLRDAKKIADRGAIERRVATLKAQQADRSSEAQRLADEEARRKQAEAERQQAEEDAQQQREQAERERAEQERLRQEREKAASASNYTPWITAGAGGALVATGLVFGFRASSTHDDAVAAPVQRDAVALQDSAERSATIANVLIVGGSIAIAAGIGWKLYQWRTAQVTATPNAVAVGGTW